MGSAPYAASAALESVLGFIQGPPPYTGPVRCWQDAIDAMPAEAASDWLRWVLRTRRYFLSVNHGTESWPVKRAELRDYLRQRDLPRWMRSRPIPEGSTGTLRYRRWIPFGRTT